MNNAEFDLKYSFLLQHIPWQMAFVKSEVMPQHIREGYNGLNYQQQQQQQTNCLSLLPFSQLLTHI